MEPMNCPECGSAMRQQTAHGVTIDRCAACGGLWFDLEEIHEYVRTKRPNARFFPEDDHFDKHTKGSGTRCSCCEEEALEVGSIGGIPFLRCTWCGGIFVKEKDLTKLTSPSFDDGGSAGSTAMGVLEVFFEIVEVFELFS